MRKVKIFAWNRYHDSTKKIYDKLMNDKDISKISEWTFNIKRYTSSNLSRFSNENTDSLTKIRQIKINKNLSKFDFIFSASYLVDFNIAEKNSLIFSKKYFQKFKPLDQKIIEFWHGPLVKKTNEFLYKENSGIDYFCSITPFTTKKLKKILGYSDEMIIKTHPTKLDNLKERYHKEININNLLKKLNVPENDYTIFSPTWFRVSDNKKIIFNLDPILKELKTKYLIVVPHHHSLKNDWIDFKYNKEVYKNNVFFVKDNSIWSWHLMFDAKFAYSTASSTLIDYYNFFEKNKVFSFTEKLDQRMELISKNFGKINDTDKFILDDKFKYYSKNEDESFDKIKELIIERFNQINNI